MLKKINKSIQHGNKDQRQVVLLARIILFCDNAIHGTIGRVTENEQTFQNLKRCLRSNILNRKSKENST